MSICFVFLNDTPTPGTYTSLSTLSLPAALPILRGQGHGFDGIRLGDLRVQLGRGGDAEMRAVLAGKQLDRVAGLEDAEGRAKVQQRPETELAVVESLHIAERRSEERSGGKGCVSTGRSRRTACH